MKKSLSALGELEMEILQYVWDLKQATVNDVREQILQQRDIAYTTVMTVMKNLHSKGYLTYYKEGTQFVYQPAKSPDSVKSNLLMGLMNTVFKGSPKSLVKSLIQTESLSEAELNEIKALINQMEEKS